MAPEQPPFSVGVVVLGGGALLLSALLVVGFLLPADWQAQASALVPAPADEVFAFLDSPEGWQAWTPWPDSGVVREGPSRGAGASLRWDDPELGSGSFRIEEATPSERVVYTVEVSGGAMRTRGSLALAPEEGGVRVRWHEEGDLGRNPLMGFWALFMERAQSTELEKGLERLSAVVTGAPEAEAPADTGSTGVR